MSIFSQLKGNSHTIHPVDIGKWLSLSKILQSSIKWNKIYKTVPNRTLMAIEENLVAHWDFTADTGDELKDISRNGSHGKIFGAKWDKDVSGVKSLEFDGIDDYVEIDVKNMSANPFKNISRGSLSVWFRVDYIPVEHGIMPIFYYGSNDLCDFYDAANNGLIIEVGHSPIFMGTKRLFYTVWANGCTLPSFC
jgi:hypothetical protein